MSFRFPFQRLSFPICNLIIFTKTFIMFDFLIHFISCFSICCILNLLSSVVQNISYLFNLNWISTKDKLLWSECSSKKCMLIISSCKKEHNIVYFLHILGKLPGLLSLHWVILRDTLRITLCTMYTMVLNQYYVIMTKTVYWTAL